MATAPPPCQKLSGTLLFLLLLLATIAINARLLLIRPLSVMTHDIQTDNPQDTHEYIRPSGSDVSGWPNNTAKNHRSPCPALNTLANHGYLPRDGKNLTPEIIKQAIMKVYNIDKSLAETLTNPLPETLTLSDLSVHGFIEHDASLVHDDAYFKTDPSAVNETLGNDLFSRANSENLITPKIIAKFRRHRENQSIKDDPEYSLSLKAQATAYSEAAILLLGLGDYNSETISVNHAHSFLVEEKIPADYKKAEKPITTSTSLYLAAKIRFLASFSSSDSEIA